MRKQLAVYPPRSLFGSHALVDIFLWSEGYRKGEIVFSGKKPPASNCEQVFRALADAWISKMLWKDKAPAQSPLPIWVSHDHRPRKSPTEHIARTSLHQEPEETNGRSFPRLLITVSCSGDVST